MGQKEIGKVMGYCSLCINIAVLLGPVLGKIVFAQSGYLAVFAMAFGLICLDIVLRLALAVIPVTEVNLARVPRALDGEVRGGGSLEGAGKGRLWRKGSRKGVDRGAQRVNALLSHLSYL
jgi:MFS family permease